MKSLLAILLLCCATLGQAAETRFDAFYFFQSEKVMQQKQVNFEELARYSRKIQSAVWKALKKAQMPASAGYLVVAVRSDGEVATWLDMTPAVHEYYDNQIYDAVRKVAPVHVESGILVFAVKMAIDTAVHTRKSFPTPPGWDDARKKLNDPDNIEELVLSLWPE
ncbi:MAG: hypothetical protein KGM99_01855 [Burkholderiales bacterium]|nr:hypothetical protein [Burkholderiales bacterium]